MSDPTPGQAPGSNPPGYRGWGVVDLESFTLVRMNEAGREMIEMAQERLPESLHTFFDPQDRDLFATEISPRLELARMWSGSLRLARGDRGSMPWPAMLVPQVDSRSTSPRYASLLFAPVETNVSPALAPDPLTGMATRPALFARLARAVAHNRANDRLLALFFIDLDGLKNINDRYGHEAGDESLVETADRILDAIPDGALAVRFGGDEFVVLYEDAQDLDQAEQMAATVLARLAQPGDYLSITASIGIAVGRSGEVGAEELVRRADAAMYRAKRHGGSQVAIFDAEMLEEQRARESLRATLLRQGPDGGFTVMAQPVFELATGRIPAVELFIRVRPDAPYIASPSELFRLAHEFGEAFDTAVLERSIRLSRVWRRTLATRAPRIQINVSTQSLAGSSFVSGVRKAIEDGDLAAGAIAFELDSDDLSTAGNRERSVVAELRRLGTAIVVDGFGDGAVTLADVQAWSPAMVKIAADTSAPAVMRGLTRAASALRVPTCVKGIESRNQLEAVVTGGAYAGQGNALAPVQSLEQIDRLLRSETRLGF